MKSQTVLISLRSHVVSALLGLIAFVAVTPASRADLTFTFSATSSGNALGYTTNQPATFVFTLHDNSPTPPAGTANGTSYVWTEELLTQPELWSVAGTGLLGTYTRPNASGGSPLSELAASSAGNSLKAYASLDSGNNGLTVNGNNLSAITMFGTYTDLTFSDITGTLPDPVDYFGTKLGTFAAVSTLNARIYDSTFAFADFTINSLTINSSAIPEPSTYAGLAGAAVLGLAAWRRRRTAGKV
jgi:hypothetical protein